MPSRKCLQSPKRAIKQLLLIQENAKRKSLIHETVDINSAFNALRAPSKQTVCELDPDRRGVRHVVTPSSLKARMDSSIGFCTGLFTPPPAHETWGGSERHPSRSSLAREDQISSRSAAHLQKRRCVTGEQFAGGEAARAENGAAPLHGFRCACTSCRSAAAEPIQGLMEVGVG